MFGVLMFNREMALRAFEKSCCQAFQIRVRDIKTSRTLNLIFAKTRQSNFVENHFIESTNGLQKYTSRGTLPLRGKTPKYHVLYNTYMNLNLGRRGVFWNNLENVNFLVPSSGFWCRWS